MLKTVKMRKIENRIILFVHLTFQNTFSHKIGKILYIPTKNQFTKREKIGFGLY